MGWSVVYSVLGVAPKDSSFGPRPLLGQCSETPPYPLLILSLKVFEPEFLCIFVGHNVFPSVYTYATF